MADLSSGGNHRNKVESQPGEAGVGEKRDVTSRPWGLAKSLVASSAKTVWGVVITVIVTAALVAWGAPAIFGSRVTVEEQVAAIRHTAARHSLYPVFGRQADLGSGVQSYVMVLRTKDTVLNTDTDDVSDIIRVYGIHGGALRLEFEYQPRAFNDGYEIEGFPYVYNVDEITDVDGNGRPELIGSFSIQSGTGLHDPVPTVISWDDYKQRFIIAPLLAHAPELTPVADPGIAQTYTQAGDPTALTSSRSSRQIRGYPVEAFGVLHRRSEPPLIIGGFLVRARDAADPQLYQAVAWTLNLTLETPDTYECPGPAVYVRPSTRASLSQELVSAWVHQRGRADCG